MRRLKEEVGKRFNLQLNEFYLVRNTNDKEIKEMATTLQAANITSYSNIKVVLGAPSLDGGYRV